MTIDEIRERLLTNFYGSGKYLPVSQVARWLTNFHYDAHNPIAQYISGDTYIHQELGDAPSTADYYIEEWGTDDELEGREEYISLEIVRRAAIRAGNIGLAKVASDIASLWAGVAPVTTPAVPAPASEAESQRARQERRYRMCTDADLLMPTDDYAHLPRGIGALAKREGITRQAFAEDVKAHIRSINGR